ncbi:MAG: hypothetical protein A2992_08100 [Elusimicrobia bacterium RIFCSPLOWO2_01_FULL_59_12]|nr:MAG: hypothetical protein A2992_08100 [Elusimicrobia bacterium RIFCSPLOWO2_01_FULL_59_12]
MKECRFAVIPAKAVLHTTPADRPTAVWRAGIQSRQHLWTPAFAGVTSWGLILTLMVPFASVYADYHPIEVTHGGTIRGLVKFPSETPPRAMFANQGDARCPRGIPQDHLIVKQETRGIQNALVILDIERGKPLPLVKVQLDNKGCRFVPRIQWAPRHGSLQLVNSDPAPHNVHAYREDTTVFSVDLPVGGSPVRRPLVASGLHKINCDYHLWTRAWVYVSEHPYVAVTDAEGRFELTDIPPGTYTLRAWHEGWIEKGTEKTGQPYLAPMTDVRRVAVRRDRVTDVLLDTLEPAFLYSR